jgi:hypothetical protein
MPTASRPRILGIAFTIGLLSTACRGHQEPPELKRIRQVEGVLRARGSVAKIQAWLAQSGKEKVVEDAAKWPPAIAELQPSRVHLVDAGGVSLTWYAEETRGVDVYPPGQRPAAEPVTATDGSQYRAELGADAYVWMRKR